MAALLKAREHLLAGYLYAVSARCNRQLVAVALGSNLDSELGDRASHLDFARAQLATLPGTTLLAVSKDYETAPVGRTPGQDAGGPYLNAAVTLETNLAPRPLLEALLDIERQRGRDRDAEQRWGPRTLDLDLLLYGDLVIDTPGLEVPHPRLHERRFVLEPLAEVASNWAVPSHDCTIGNLLCAVDATPVEH